MLPEPRTALLETQGRRATRDRAGGSLLFFPVASHDGRAAPTFAGGIVEQLKVVKGWG